MPSETEIPTAEKTSRIAFKQILSEIKWMEYFTKLMWRVLFIPLYFVLAIAFPLAVLINVLIWLITGRGYMSAIEQAAEWCAESIWRKVFK